MTANEVRKAFLDFFESKSHKIVPSAPMVIKNDPTLMFTNAGMNQFKELFLGQAEITASRIADSQKCLRVSGKHNDLEEVGHDTYHHTMFEMLGNWSFGDYFKQEAIDWAWEFLVDVLKLNPNRLYATVFEGSADDKLEMDTEARQIWAKRLPEQRILLGSKKDNFWEMGDTGPCGPCSELHIDMRSDEEIAHIPGHQLVNKDHPQVIEIWNLVFIQYNRKANGQLEQLPNKHVDTGMGFERLVRALQQKNSNYDTDIFTPFLEKIGELSALKYGTNEKIDIAMRVVSDHFRTIAFAIADGQLPSSNKAGYVIRRILRRSVRYSFTFLNQKQPFMYKLLPTLIQTMGNAYPELEKNKELISKVIFEEETAFLRTLDTGIRLLTQVIEALELEQKTEISGKIAFELYDSYGFPLDLTQLIAKEHHFTVDLAEFDTNMAAQKQRSRNAAAVTTQDWVMLNNQEHGQFVGYDTISAQVHLLRYRAVTQQNQTLYQLVFNQTPFYAESGGQVGDKGYIEANGQKINVIDTQKEHNLTVHIVEQMPDNPDATFNAVVNNSQRRQTEANHSATHLLHAALREVLGTHVEQKGSLVEPERLRFDFSHFQKMTSHELKQIEQHVNAKIRENLPLDEYREIPLTKAREMGAMALFGEKYGDTVRVIKFGNSVEFCGGCHVSATGKIGFFKIVSESAVAAGVRRIEAITADKAEEFIDDKLETLADLKEMLNAKIDLRKAVEKLMLENNALTKQLEKFAKLQTAQIKTELKAKIKQQNGINYLIEAVDLDAAGVKDVVFQLKNEMSDLFVVLGSQTNEKPTLSVMISDNLVKEKNWHAGQIVKELAKAIKGGGGGQPFFATAGGKDVAGLSLALKNAREKYMA